MKKKKNLFIIAFLCFITLVGVTIAYLQSTDTFENIFNAGTYKTITNEEFTSPSNWTPGDETPKTITTKNEGTITVRVRVKLEENWKNSNNEELPLEFADSKKASIINLDNEVDWIYKEGYYYYLYELLPGEETTSPIKSVTFNPEYEGNVTCNYNSSTNSNECSSSDEYMGGVYTLNITTETVQADAYETLWENVPIMYNYVGDNPCTYEGELVPGAEYVNGQYTYKYRYSGEIKLEEEGWSVKLTDKSSLDSVTTTLCSSINNKPIVSMKSMFGSAKSQSIDFSSFDTSNVTDMSAMFSFSKTTTLDLSSFDTSNVINMKMMFYASKATSLDLNGFDTSRVTDMSSMFSNSQAATINLSSFDTHKVTNMSYMFCLSQITSINVSNFNTSNVTDMSGMFGKSKIQTLDLSNFDTSNVTNMGSMFYGSEVTILDLSSFDTGSVLNFENMFINSVATTGYAKTQSDADRFNASSNKPSTLTFVVKNG